MPHLPPIETLLATGLLIAVGTITALRGPDALPRGVESWEVELPAAAVCLPGGSHRATLHRRAGLAELRFVTAGAIIHAEIEGESLRGQGRVRATTGCPEGRVSVIGRLVVSPSGSEALVGLLRPTLCADCAPTPFHAIRR
jgi:energy-converting hydrogenase Eha subunit E